MGRTSKRQSAGKGAGTPASTSGVQKNRQYKAVRGARDDILRRVQAHIEDK